ncbi:Histone-lysine N-methyltransferase SETMAR [Eumeta japonica]|uniref:Histone-lysine N-methyltransferase SETMAR n=1 Tax=Eumeta variegata TaxID=151549 RepID=A0A4C1YEE8_EUMVA|nr:Histone-lysine N-methyltransferase SETMAR [Eumeta japonica]
MLYSDESSVKERKSVLGVSPQLPNICSVQNWFKHFQSDNFDVKHELRSGRPVTDKVDAILEKAEQDVVEELGIDHKIDLTRFKKGIIHYELLAPGKTISSNLYCQQLMRLKQEVEKKRSKLINREGVIFHYDNVRPHTSLAPQQILREFDWKMLMHPPYSPNLASTDFHLYKYRQNSGGDFRPALTVAAYNVAYIYTVVGKFLSPRDVSLHMTQGTQRTLLSTCRVVIDNSNGSKGDDDESGARAVRRGRRGRVRHLIGPTRLSNKP